MQATLRRSGRARRVDYSAILAMPPYPDGPPESDIEKTIHALNLQAFPERRYAEIDDILVYCLFSSKKRPECLRSMEIAHILERKIDSDEGLTICALCLAGIDAYDPTRKQCAQVAEDLIRLFPKHFQLGDKEIMEHLLMRYKLLYSRYSSIKLSKVSFDGKTISAGLQSTQFINASTCILTSCGSMAKNISASKGGISFIQSKSWQRGPVGIRLILGPFRFANHDCNPNCQFVPIEGTHAYALASLRPIEPNEPITVAYTANGYSGEDCRCATCKPTSPPLAPRADPDVNKPTGNKKRHRGGSRAKRRRRDIQPEVHNTSASTN